MKTLRNGFVFAALLSLTACSGAETSSPETIEPTAVADETAVASAQEVTIFDCQRQVAQCTLSARSFFDLGRCTTQFQGCTAQAAADLLGQSNLLKDCRTSANACLEGAVTLSDVTACRNVFESCAGDVQETVGGVVKTAVDAAKDAIGIAVDVAIDTIGAAGDLAGGAIDAVEACQAQSLQCLEGVVTVSDVSECRDVFDECVGGAVSLVDDLVAPLPGPTPTELIDGFADCQAKSESCLGGALTLTDLTACQTTLQTCVQDATDLVKGTVDDVNQILPLPLPTQPLDCTAQAAQCLLSFGNPLTCAEQATQCLLP
jgi:hypothetical protein